MNATHVRAALYARVSSQKQADDKTIESQHHDIAARIDADGLTLPEEHVFLDDGYSGAELLRPALEELRDRVAASLIDRIYIHSPDRLARKMAHQALLLEEFARHDCQVVFLNQQGLPGSPETNLLIQMQGMIAEYEREKILERTRRGRRHAATAGRVSVFAGAPYGYRYVSKAEGDGHARWEIDPRESAHVRLMFELVGRRGCTLSQVARELADKGVRTRNGKPHWDRATIRGILINPAYYGQARYGRERLVPRKPGKRAKRGDPAVPRKVKVSVATDPSEQIAIAVPPLVEEELFQRAGEQMAENQKRQRQRHTPSKALLSGLTVCGECGSAYCRYRTSARRYSYYRCIGADKHRRRGRAVCTNDSVKGEELERAVWSELVKLLKDPARLRAELNRRLEERQHPGERLREQERSVAALRGRLDRLIDAYETGIIQRDEFESRIGSLRARHDRESTALASLRGELSDAIDVDSAERALQQLADDVGARLATADEPLKRQLLQLLIHQIEIHRQEIRIVYKVLPPPFAERPINRGDLQHWLRRVPAAASIVVVAIAPLLDRPFSAHNCAKALLRPGKQCLQSGSQAPACPVCLGKKAALSKLCFDRTLLAASSEAELRDCSFPSRSLGTRSIRLQGEPRREGLTKRTAIQNAKQPGCFKQPGC
jgi:site-specific DNA recombinase